MTARFFKNITGGFRIQTDSVQLSLTDDETKEILTEALDYIQIDSAGKVPAQNLVWLSTRETTS